MSDISKLSLENLSFIVDGWTHQINLITTLLASTGSLCCCHHVRSLCEFFVWSSVRNIPAILTRTAAAAAARRPSLPSKGRAGNNVQRQRNLHYGSIVNYAHSTLHLRSIPPRRRAAAPPRRHQRVDVACVKLKSLVISRSVIWKMNIYGFQLHWCHCTARYAPWFISVHR